MGKLRLEEWLRVSWPRLHLTRQSPPFRPDVVAGCCHDRETVSGPRYRRTVISARDGGQRFSPMRKDAGHSTSEFLKSEPEKGLGERKRSRLDCCTIV